MLYGFEDCARLAQWDDDALIVREADAAMRSGAEHITDAINPRSAGGAHDFSSCGDYWWPNPDTADGLPYVRRDGKTNPDNFDDHRRILRAMRTKVDYLTAAALRTGTRAYGERAVRLLREFFLEDATKMNPSLRYAQAIPGVCEGRGIGIIDTLHLMDVTQAAVLLEAHGFLAPAPAQELRCWFAQYLEWLFTSEEGRTEMQEKNNHSVCFFAQAAAFARFVGDGRTLALCRAQYRQVLLRQMAPDGSFPLELARTKPYSYSLFVLDNMVTLCALLSAPGEDLWQFCLPEGQSIARGIAFMQPYVLNKSAWPYARDVMHFDAFPARASFMMFAGCRLGNEPLRRLYLSLPQQTADEEARRNLAIRLPRLWLM